MAKNAVKIRLKGHESFNIREGWIRKGIKGIVADPLILSKSNAIDELGVGANMVKSIRYWLQATGVTKEVSVEGKKQQVLTEGFGKLFVENDMFFESKFTLALMHYKLATNFEAATSWYLFFNKVDVNEFNRGMLFGYMDQQLKNIDTSLEYSEKSLLDDCNCILKTYAYDREDLRNPEDNLVCPLSELGLVTILRTKGKDDTIIKSVPSKEVLHELAVLYVIVNRLNGGNTTTIEKLVEEDGNIGKVFNLDKNRVNEYINILEEQKYLQINRTAGLNTIYINEITEEEIIKKYFVVE